MSHPPQPIKTYVGVDGCKGGWIAVRLDAEGKFLNAQVYADFEELWAEENASGKLEVQLLLIDIPIGLPDQKILYRECDKEGRKLLKERHCCIFSPPCYAALSHKEHKAASAYNRQIVGKGISIQAHSISKRIKEVNDFLRLNPTLPNRIRETHPELAFLSLNGGKVIVESKKSSLGKTNRLDLLNTKCRDGFEKAKSQLSKSIDYQRDHEIKMADNDIIDALVAALIARNKIRSIPNIEQSDSTGLKMEIVVANIKP